jgi:hypothetical protein
MITITGIRWRRIGSKAARVYVNVKNGGKKAEWVWVHVVDSDTGKVIGRKQKSRLRAGKSKMFKFTLIPLQFHRLKAQAGRIF